MSYLTNPYRYAVDPYLISPSTYSSTDGWTDDNDDMSIDTVNEGITYSTVNDTGGISRVLTENLETKFVCKFYFNLSAYTSNDLQTISLTPDITKSPADSSLQTLWIAVAYAYGYTNWCLNFHNLTTNYQLCSASLTFGLNTTYYVTMDRDVDTLTTKIRTGSHTGTLLSTLTVDLTSGTGLSQTLDGIQHYSRSANQGATGYLRGVYLQNGVTSF